MAGGLNKQLSQKFFAHSLPGRPPEEWQPLDEHLQNVAEKARGFAEKFDAGRWGYSAGLLHDIGKYSREFQKMLLDSQDDEDSSEFKRGPDHSSAGAQEVNKLISNGFGKLLAYCIAGHHAGLLDAKSTGASLCNRLNKTIPDYSNCPSETLDVRENLSLPPNVLNDKDSKSIAFRLSFFVRMIFSCLVDADFLDTETFMDRSKASCRGNVASIAELRNKVIAETERLSRQAPSSLVNQIRRGVLEQCLKKALETPGIFSLTVPTGGGKTLSSLAFALEHAVTHAKKHRMERIIYVIPYTSIIEQNADVFRRVCGDDAVIEHHSNYEFKEDSYKAQLASENWDAPLIVTTNVQFFESLFNCRTSKCRKMHNIANSVIILDEAQSLPVNLLKPCIEVIKELANTYKSTIVLCSATQPALSKSDEFKNGIEGVREIVDDAQVLYNSLRRVSIKRLACSASEDVSSEINKHDQVLCVVNTRKHARQLYESIPDKEGLFHLSGLMCPAHRSETLDAIRNNLAKGKKCRVISTQLIEAGVDIDFPAVFRALAGIDSIAQAAGRCNREGKLADGGTVYIFEPENAAPMGFLRQSIETAQGIIRRHEDDILSISAINEYFRELYWKKSDELDKKGILDILSESVGSCDFQFRTVSDKFRLIENDMRTIAVPFDENARKLIRALKASDSRAISRKLQRYCVQVYPDVITRLGRAALEPLHERYYVLINDHLYKHDIGLDFDNPCFRNVESDIC